MAATPQDLTSKTHIDGANPVMAPATSTSSKIGAVTNGQPSERQTEPFNAVASIAGIYQSFANLLALQKSLSSIAQQVVKQDVENLQSAIKASESLANEFPVTLDLDAIAKKVQERCKAEGIVYDAVNLADTKIDFNKLNPKIAEIYKDVLRESHEEARKEKLLLNGDNNAGLAERLKTLTTHGLIKDENIAAPKTKEELEKISQRISIEETKLQQNLSELKKNELQSQLNPAISQNFEQDYSKLHTEITTLAEQRTIELSKVTTESTATESSKESSKDLNNLPNDPENNNPNKNSLTLAMPSFVLSSTAFAGGATATLATHTIQSFTRLLVGDPSGKTIEGGLVAFAKMLNDAQNQSTNKNDLILLVNGAKFLAFLLDIPLTIGKQGFEYIAKEAASPGQLKFYNTIANLASHKEVSDKAISEANKPKEADKPADALKLNLAADPNAFVAKG